MKILLLGEYSNTHWGLAKGLKHLGHDVTVVSNGDYWKNYPSDIKLIRRGYGLLDSLKYFNKACQVIDSIVDYDIVQLINPIFLDLKAEHFPRLYRKMRKKNDKIFLCAYGIDHYYISACLTTNLFKYSEFCTPEGFRDIPFNRMAVEEWMDNNRGKGGLNKMIAQDCNGIIAGLWEYYVSYYAKFPEKTTYIPFPVEMESNGIINLNREIDKVIFFIGVQKDRELFKGTDILYKVLKKLESDYPYLCRVIRVENVPFEEYKKLLEGSDVLVDQLYSPSPNMNSLLAMSKGIVVAGGGEEEPYMLLGESSLRPVINLPYNEKEIYLVLKELITHPEKLSRLKSESMEFVKRHHDPVQVAEQYLKFWNSR
ncbi:MAG TPA: glycosyltransferase family 1 protein [Bacteroidaceae bacterium]|nr:glycosyltransferase family 1 protein [Bacteroidaceae bacterium]